MRPLVLSLLAFAALFGGAIRAEERSRWQYDAHLLHPYWQGEIMYGEPILFVTDTLSGETAANLLYPMTEVLEVCNSAGDVTYENGRDFVWTPGSRRIVLPAGSRITALSADQLRRPANSQKYKLTHRDGNGEILFGSGLEYHQMQTCVTYRHASVPRPNLPRFDERALPRSIAKLRSQTPLSIVLLGDSISTGCNASGWAGGAPFQPPYHELLDQHLEARTGTSVNLTNLAVGGTDTAWGLTKVEEIVASKPDLVILAFGMNDSAGRSAADYQANIEAMMARIREQAPDVEFILVASMLGNRDWTALQHERFPEYRDALAKKCSAGIALADLTTVWTDFFEFKRDWDLTGNGVNHPNDFGHRVYAQVIASLLIAEE